MTDIKYFGYTSEEIWWTLGVLNVFLSAWLAGAIPHVYWIWHLLKMSFLIVWRGREYIKKKMGLILFDYCFLVNYLFYIYYILSLFMSMNSNSGKDYGYISEYIFRILFTASVGPLALSIVFMRNSLVFHDLNSISILALHWSPNIAIWGQRWFTKDFTF